MCAVDSRRKQWAASGQGPEGQLMVQNIKCECENMRRAATLHSGNRSSQRRKIGCTQPVRTGEMRICLTPPKPSIIIKNTNCPQRRMWKKAAQSSQTGHQPSIDYGLGPWGSCHSYFALPDTPQWAWQPSALARGSHSQLLRSTSGGAAIKLWPQLHHHRADCCKQAN